MKEKLCIQTYVVVYFIASAGLYLVKACTLYRLKQLRGWDRIWCVLKTFEYGKTGRVTGQMATMCN